MVNGHRLFYCEAGDPDKPTFVLLHGFPTSSFMFRTLIPLPAVDHVAALIRPFLQPISRGQS
jgi:pimeloyl-ACP methyl ester carboxylesterase